ncbi:hypothetical protein [Burkholderia sp. S-53]|uniref:hypothetical protein n=1 Tax=Burkholderia sp. S-53 TaxID=2906514 RepID=UPI0021CEBCA0|nr:hypothetical protein [Burkholderia sp. S-53]UXU86049.1 hypothetical protein LXM88_01835 [Burkholderia sp. S-53]
MTITDAVVRAGALAAVLFAANRMREKGMLTRQPAKSKSAARQRVAATVVSALILVFYLYIVRHYIANIFK